jgi:hypothetical protein
LLKSKKNFTILKAYLANTYFDVTYLTKYFDLPPEDILNIAAKISLDSDSNEHINKILSSLKLEDIDLGIETEEMFLAEILTSVDQILHFTSVNIWSSHLEKTRQAVAAIKLKSKMKSMEIVRSTLATAQALERATKNANSSSLKNDLRISNLEKSLQKQENKANEIINQMKRKQPLKNSSGSHLRESVTSPQKTTPSNKQIKTTKHMVDLTLDNHNEEQHSFSRRKQKPKQKPSLGKSHSQHPRQKTVQWNDTEEVKNYHLNHPVSQSALPRPGSNPFTTHSHSTMPTFFQQAHPPLPPPHYFPQAQLPGHMFHPNYLDTVPFQLLQQEINIAPIQTLHHNPMQRNNPNPFKHFIQTQNNLTYTNPFGTSQTIHPHSQYKK